MPQFDDMIPEYVAESRDLLPQVEHGLLALEKDPGSVQAETVNSIFRAIHSIKGGASFVGLHRLEQLAHKMEDILNLIRNGDMAPTKAVSSELLRGLDQLTSMLDHIEGSNSVDVTAHLAALQALIDHQTSDDVRSAIATPATSAQNGLEAFQVDSYTLSKKFQQGFIYSLGFDLMALEGQGFNPLRLTQELISLGEILDAQVSVSASQDDPLEASSLLLRVLFFSLLEEELFKMGLHPQPLEVVRVEESDFTATPSPVPAQAPTPPPEPELEETPEVTSPSFDAPLEVGPTPAEPAAAARPSPPDRTGPLPRKQAEDHDHGVGVALPGEYLTFFLAEEEYAVETSQVQEIISRQPMARLPNAPGFVKGVINLRGMVVPVLDLREKLGFASKAYDKHTVIVVVRVKGKTTGLIVDSVSEVFELQGSQIQPPPDLAQGASSDYVKGLAKLHGRFLILLSLDRLLRREELV